jgi:hypothetical protein
MGERTRLGIIFPDLEKDLKRLSPAGLRDVAAAAAREATRIIGIANTTVEEGIAALAGAHYGDPSLTGRLRSLVEELDGIQWDLQDGVDEGRKEKAAQSKAFREARAVNALYYALQANPLEAALEALYEAHAAIQDVPTIRKLLEASASRFREEK